MVVFDPNPNRLENAMLVLPYILIEISMVVLFSMVVFSNSSIDILKFGSISLDIAVRNIECEIIFDIPWLLCLILLTELLILHTNKHSSKALEITPEIVDRPVHLLLSSLTLILMMIIAKKDSVEELRQKKIIPPSEIAEKAVHRNEFDKKAVHRNEIDIKVVVGDAVHGKEIDKKAKEVRQKKITPLSEIAEKAVHRNEFDKKAAYRNEIDKKIVLGDAVHGNETDKKAVHLNEFDQNIPQRNEDDKKVVLGNEIDKKAVHGNEIDEKAVHGNKFDQKVVQRNGVDKKVVLGNKVDKKAVCTSEFDCPITLSLMIDPVIAADGFSYERESIQEWIDRDVKKGKTPISPKTQLKLEHNCLTSNRVLLILINQYRLTLDSNPSSPARKSLSPPIEAVISSSNNTGEEKDYDVIDSSNKKSDDSDDDELWRLSKNQKNLSYLSVLNKNQKKSS